MTYEIPSGFVKGDRFEGIVNTRGQKAGVEQNWGYYARDNEGNECALMYCNPGLFTILDRNVLENIRKINGKQVSWYGMKTGYVGCHTEVDSKSTCLTLHQVLMNHYGYGKEGPSIDHINRNKLDNRLQNLRIVSQSIQNANRDKVGRHRSAKDLPAELNEEKLPIFVVYYKEKVGKSENGYREYFTVEGHPIQRDKEKGIVTNQTKQLRARRWATTKSNAVSINTKLEHAKAYVKELNHLAANPDYILSLPSILKEIEPASVISDEVKEELQSTNEKEMSSISSSHVSPRIPRSRKKLQTTLFPVPLDSVETTNMLQKKTNIPKQWKSSIIYRAIQHHQENEYKTFCEQNNDMSLLPTWETDWATFVLSVKGRSEADALPLITAFVENLRRIRHNKLCYDKNASLVEKEDRQQWPAATVVRAFLEGKMEAFKAFTEASTGENPEDPKWVKRWTGFMDSLEKARADHEQMKTLCSKFMTAQRTKKYRAKAKE
jgi:Zn-finger protein